MGGTSGPLHHFHCGRDEHRDRADWQHPRQSVCETPVIGARAWLTAYRRSSAVTRLSGAVMRVPLEFIAIS